MTNLTRRHFLKGAALFLGAACCSPNVLAAAMLGGPAANTLIACFSHTGNTALVAEEIQGLTRGILHRICTVEVYPKEHDACTRIAGKEFWADFRPRLPSGVEGMERCATVFLGYPIWWYTMPWPAAPFLRRMILRTKRLFPSVPTAETALPTVCGTYGDCAPKTRYLPDTTRTMPMRRTCPQRLRIGLRVSACLQADLPAEKTEGTNGECHEEYVFWEGAFYARPCRGTVCHSKGVRSGGNHDKRNSHHDHRRQSHPAGEPAGQRHKQGPGSPISPDTS